MVFHLTDAGRAALVDGASRGTVAVTFTKMAIGDVAAMPGVDYRARTALRNQRLQSALVAATSVASSVAVSAEFAGTPGEQPWEVREAGLLAQVGAGPEFLALYGAVLASDDQIADIVAGVDVTIGAVVRVDSSAAVVAVAVAPDITVAGVTRFRDLADTPDAIAPGAYYRADAEGVALEAAASATVLSDLLAALAGGDYLRVSVAGGVRSLEGLTAEELGAAL